jgi:hypothetical protein
LEQTEEKQVAAVDAIKKNITMNRLLVIICMMAVVKLNAQSIQDTSKVYKKRVLETSEVDFLTSYYSQDGENAAVSGGLGTEELTDVATSIIVSIPLNDDDVLTIDVSVSAYTSASSSNVDPFDSGYGDPFQASSGASSGDVWANITASYSHSSDDRNTMWSAHISISDEYDYSSLGFGGSFSKLFNEKNTELSINGNVYLDTWRALYPIELRPFAEGGNGLDDPLFTQNTITGNPNYSPLFKPFDQEARNSFLLGLFFSQILHKNLQASLSMDFVQQQGLLSTPFQRVYFNDVAESYIDSFQLADAIEQLPDSRFKVAIGGRLNWYLNEVLTVRTFYRYYFDDWGISSNTASIEIPVKITEKFTLYPSYRFYNQTAADYFRPHNTALSTEEFYASDYDLSEFTANQFGFGVTYTDIFAKAHIGKWGLKSIDLAFYKYDRNSSFSSYIISAGVKFVID